MNEHIPFDVVVVVVFVVVQENDYRAIDVPLKPVGITKSAQAAFEALRDAAIENLSIALHAAHTLDKFCVPALVANVSSRLFNAEKQEKYVIQSSISSFQIILK